ncbi:MAG: NAD(P)H-hydrate dehydratase [Candidatus Kaiserbacteria bacterium]|nr:MAG: NAD(P)H-hydrate dehydratase [Candidatus Kaiserbacteria bacterium]
MQRVLVVGGSEEYVGAVYLAAISALRAGAESVVVMTPERVAWALNALSPDLMTKKLKGKFLSTTHLSIIKKQAKTADILLLGNGAGVRPATQRLMRELARLPLPKVIDADGVKALRGSDLRNAILTPNAGEWKLLQKNADIKKIVARGNVILQKGPSTKIWTSNVHISLKVNKGLAKAGTGDVLAGLCAGFLAAGLAPLAAAKKACAVSNAAADVLTKRKRGYYFLASDVAVEIKKMR